MGFQLSEIAIPQINEYSLVERDFKKQQIEVRYSFKNSILNQCSG